MYSRFEDLFCRFSSLSQKTTLGTVLSDQSQPKNRHTPIVSLLLLMLSTGLSAQQTEPPQTENKSEIAKSVEMSHAKINGSEELTDPQQTETLSPSENESSVHELSTVQKDQWLFLHNYEAKYAVQSEGKTLGHATRRLTYKDNQWILSTHAKIKKYFISVRNTETTEFHLQDNLLVNHRFYSKTKITFKKARVMEQLFDWKNKQETGKRGDKSWQIPLEKQVFDRVSHIMQLRADLLAGKKVFDYDVSYKGKLHVYSYIEEKKEVLQTKMGALTGIKLVRNKPNGDVFTLWLCPELNYLPIKIAQYEQDKSDITLLLESIEYQSE